MTMFKPQLAPNDDPLKNPKFFDFITYPCIVSPKLDGIRGVTHSGGCMSRTSKPLPNKRLQAKFAQYQGLDGEFIDGSPMDEDVYNRTQSTIMSHDADISNVKYYVFDSPLPSHKNLHFSDRLRMITHYVRQLEHDDIIALPQMLINSYEELIIYETAQLELGYEGIMIRRPSAEYKYGRATMKQGHIVKLKRFQDDEAKVIGFLEQMTNTNPSSISETGASVRGHSQEGKIPAGTLGTIICMFNGIKIEVSCGIMTHAERQHVWDNQDKFISRYITFRHFAHGASDKPRFPRYYGWCNMEHK